MKEYFISLTSVAILCGIVGILAPKEDIGKYIRFLCGLCVLVFLLIPFGRIFESLGDLSSMLEDSVSQVTMENYEKLFEESIKSGASEEVSFIMEDKVVMAFGVPKDAIDIKVNVDSHGDSHYIKNAVLKIQPQGWLIDAGKIKEYVEETLGCSCAVVYEEEE